MTRARAWRAAAVALVASVLLAAASASAKPSISLTRGINLDLWVTWPTPAAMADPAVVETFPEWRRTVPVERLRDLKAAGFDFVRLPIDPAAIAAQKTAAGRDRLLARTVEATRSILSLGLSVVVDLHPISRPEPAFGTERILGDAGDFARFSAMVTDLAERLTALPADRVALELLNEPIADCDSAEGRRAAARWQGQAETLHAAARAAAPGLTLVISGSCWGGGHGLSLMEARRFDDDNIIWSFHAYEPFLASHQSARWVRDLPCLFSGLPYPPDRLDDAAAQRALAAAGRRLSHPRAGACGALRGVTPDMLLQALARYRAEYRADMARPFAAVETWRQAQGLPASRVLLGEFGAIRRDGPRAAMAVGDRARLMGDLRRLAEAHGFAWAVWSYGGTFAITEGDRTRRLDPVILDELGLRARQQ